MRGSFTKPSVYITLIISFILGLPGGYLVGWGAESGPGEASGVGGVLLAIAVMLFIVGLANWDTVDRR